MFGFRSLASWPRPLDRSYFGLDPRRPGVKMFVLSGTLQCIVMMVAVTHQDRTITHVLPSDPDVHVGAGFEYAVCALYSPGTQRGMPWILGHQLDCLVNRVLRYWIQAGKILRKPW